jgi:hypothetical protein
MQNKTVMYLSFLISCLGISQLIPFGQFGPFIISCALFSEYFGYWRMCLLWTTPLFISEIPTYPLVQQFGSNTIHNVLPWMFSHIDTQTPATHFFSTFPQAHSYLSQLLPQTVSGGMLVTFTDYAAVLSWVLGISLTFIAGYINIYAIHKALKKIGIYKRITL